MAAYAKLIDDQDESRQRTI